jgi:hypothetical protein
MRADGAAAESAAKAHVSLVSEASAVFAERPAAELRPFQPAHG